MVALLATVLIPRDGTFDLVTLTVTGRYTPLVADYDGNGRDDVLWYR